MSKDCTFLNGRNGKPHVYFATIKKNLTNTDRWSLTLNDKDCIKEMDLVSQKKKKKTKIS